MRAQAVSQLVVAGFGNQDQCFWLNFYATFLIRFVFSVWGVGYFWVLYFAGSSRHDTTCVSLLYLHWSQFVSHWESAQQWLQCGPHRWCTAAWSPGHWAWFVAHFRQRKHRSPPWQVGWLQLFVTIMSSYLASWSDCNLIPDTCSLLPLTPSLSLSQ
jgi:hypothetical protein